MELKWHGEKAAREIPEGRIVLVQRMDRGLKQYRAVEVLSHFRPDWVGSVSGYGDTPMRFAVLNNFLGLGL